MRRCLFHLLCTSLLFLVTQVCQGTTTTETISFPAIGKLTIYKPAKPEDILVIFFSGDGGWNSGVVDMARSIASLGAYVLGVDIREYQKKLETSSKKCVYPAADLENLSHLVERKLRFATYHPPIIAGFSSGATLVYGILAESPKSLFSGGITLGFCPDLEIKKPLCKGEGLAMSTLPKHKGYDLKPASKLSAPWFALNGMKDQVCNFPKVKEFINKTKDASLVELPKVGHGFSVYKNWFPQFKDTFLLLKSRHKPNIIRIARRHQQAQPLPTNISGDSPEILSNLPLTEVQAKYDGPHDICALFISGDGGWASLDEEVSLYLADHNIPVIGLSSLQYFWQAKTPQNTSTTFDAIISHYSQKWKCAKMILIGYSFGADILPFTYNLLIKKQKDRVSALVLLSPGNAASFEISVSDWISDDTSDHYPVVPEFNKVNIPIFCLFGEDQDDCPCQKLLNLSQLKSAILPGGHHFDGDYEGLSAKIIDFMKNLK